MRKDPTRKPNRTNFITFSRQLKPQPPYYSRPWWCYINTLIFYGPNCKELWRQEIPEADLFFAKGFFNWLDVPRFYLKDSRMQVRRDRKYGWILEFTLSHEEAAKIWGMLFKNHPEIASEYDRDKGQYFVSKVPSVNIERKEEV
jgi:hypothetical protein